MTTLPKGMIFDIARDAGITLGRDGPKVSIRCPFHDDNDPSAFLSDRNIFFCFVCTPGRGWTAKRFAQELGLKWKGASLRSSFVPPPKAKVPTPPSISRGDLVRVWRNALDRALDDRAVDKNRLAYGYLRDRGLLDARDRRGFGLVAEGMDLPEPIAWWPRWGYRIVVPLYSIGGVIANIQARSIRSKPRKKTQFPLGLPARGTLFANDAGLDLLRGRWSGDRRVVLGEGLTDFLALTIATEYPVLSVPGTSLAAAAIGPWACSRTVIIALDCDSTGDGAVGEVVDLALRHGASAVVRLRWTPPHKDACEELGARGAHGLADLLQSAPAEVTDVA